MHPFLRLVRIEHALMLAVAVLIGATATLGGFPQLDAVLLLALIVPVFSEMGSFALNDCLDVETDRLNKRKDRPLVSGEISPKTAFRFAWCAFLVSLAAAYLINMYAFAISVIFNLLAIAYDYKLKDMPALGNIYIGLSMGIPFIFGNYVYSTQLAPASVFLFAIAVYLGFAREVLKSVEDMEGDKKARGSRTLPVVIGEENALRLVSVMMIAFFPLCAVPFFFLFRPDPISLGVMLASALYVAKIGLGFIGGIADAEMLGKARTGTLMAMAFGLLAILLAVLGF
ncbi:MAG: UbiA family prenyltransferase [Candidatus Bilamarchaeaceae archaeon]